MSRYVKHLDNGTVVAYGFDHAFGYFIDVFSSKDEDADIILSESSLHTQMSNGTMIELMDLYKLPESHIEQVALDLPIN
jgi:hypothetical protein